MLITNLTQDKYKYRIDSRLIEECIKNPYCDHLFIEMEHRTHSRSNSNVIPFYRSSFDKCFPNILTHVPIFLVSKSEVLQQFKVGYFGHIDDVLVPNDIFNAPDLSDRPTDDDFDYYPGERYEMIDLLGLYTREYPQTGTYGIEQSKPRIFIWVDKIFDIVEGDNHKFRILSTFVILHELAHAMMDINLTGCYHQNRTAFPRSFYTLKEESLANAIALSLLKENVSETDWNFAVDFAKNQPFQYALGVEYLDNGHLDESSVHYWMIIKETTDYSKTVVKEWMNYVYGSRPLDCKQLEWLDEGMWRKDSLFKYRDEYYDSHNVCVEVIKNYVAEHNPTRAQLHNAFPDSLNSNFEAIINYPEQTEFHDTSDSHTRSVFEENVIDSSDGKMAICDYWHPSDMNGFVDNARKLGITIISY